MRTTLATLGAVALAVASLLLATVIGSRSALAAEPDIVGTWAEDITTCKVPQDDQNAPMVITRNGYDQHETHCTFKKVDGSGSVWKVSAECSVEGDAQKADLTMTLSGDTLTIGEGGETRDYLRCKN